MEKENWGIIIFGVLVIPTLILVGILLMPHNDSIIYKTYEEGFEISHMETAGKHFIISARNDRDSFSIAVDSATYARFIVNDIIHVKVTVYENEGKYYNDYEILGGEDYYAVRK